MTVVSWSFRVRWAVYALVLTAAEIGRGAAAAAADAPELRLEPCTIPSVGEPLRCGIHHVPENRSLRNGRLLPLKVILVPARRPQPSKVPIFILAGGPGQTITDAAPIISKSWERENHDVILVDQRGTGVGHRLDCLLEPRQSPFSTPFEAGFARSCSRLLSKRHDLRQFTTAASVADLDDVRRAMGFEQIALQAVSFGTYLALMYMREHPSAVHSALLYSVVSPRNPVPLHFSQSAQDALDGLAAECSRDSQCNADFPTFRDDFDRVLARLKRSPAVVALEPGKPAVEFTAADFADSVRILLYSHARSRHIPMFVSRAAAGDFQPLVRTAAGAARAFYSGARWGLFFSVTCNEFVSRIAPAEIRPANAGTFLGERRVRAQIEACRAWPRTKLPPRFFAPFRVGVPTVLVSGDLDPVTPAKWGEEVRRSVPNSVHLVVPGGHGPWNPCLADVGRQLFATGSVAGIAAKCAGRFHAEPFRTGLP